MDNKKLNIDANTLINGIQQLVDSKHAPQTTNNSLSETLKSLEVKATDELKPPIKAWMQEKGENKAILGSLENFSVITGKAKSRKSFFLNISVSAVLGKDKLLNQFKGCLPHHKRKVLYFDTEQGKYHVQLALNRICKQIEVEVPEDLTVYGLRSKAPHERLELIEHAINTTENLGFVVIDGIKDLITSINDEAEASMIATKLLKWTEEKEIHVVTVLHQNKSDNNARGHIGTELINKAETVLSVTKSDEDKDISIVEPQQCRNREPEPFAFEIDENGIPILARDWQLRVEKKASKVDLTDMVDEDIYAILQDVYAKHKLISYGELVRLVKLSIKALYDKKAGDNSVKTLITYCKENYWLIQEKPKAPYSLGQFEIPDEEVNGTV